MTKVISVRFKEGGKEYYFSPENNKVEIGDKIIVEMQSGFVLYPVYQFNQNMLKELDPQGCERYMEDWGKQCQIEQDKMNEEMFGPDWRKMFGEEECL